MVLLQESMCLAINAGLYSKKGNIGSTFQKNVNKMCF